MPDEDNNNSLMGGDGITNLVLGLIGVLLLSRLIQKLPQILQEQFGGVSAYISNFASTSLYTALVVASVGFSAVCLAGAVYAAIRTSQIRGAQRRELKALTHQAISGEDTENERWQEVLSYAASDDEELWRLAVIEADVMLDDMLEAAGYPQEELGAKLRNVERSAFRTIDQAWEAHKLRNVIAHEGSSYNLTKREVQQAMEQYRQVFNEFGYI
ncbi:MAG: hypothetical protein BRC24_00325 [Parcubacteria group bacterium SW_4_46_8]|nr:MAG: hypothetical protein BRC24_00325 [Parcubacteria group bacterium SW_4_46_8]